MIRFNVKWFLRRKWLNIFSVSYVKLNSVVADIFYFCSNYHLVDNHFWISANQNTLLSIAILLNLRSSPRLKLYKLSNNEVILTFDSSRPKGFREDFSTIKITEKPGIYVTEMYIMYLLFKFQSFSFQIGIKITSLAEDLDL